MRIGLFGGTFNPIHNEHILMANEAIKELNLDKLLVMPTYVSPHKIGKEVAPGEDRIKMAKLVFQNNPKVEVSDYEISKKGISYTYQTLEYLTEEYGGAEIFFLLGSDMLENFPKWRNPDLICNMATLALTERRGEGLDNELLIKIVEERFNTKVVKLKVYGNDISSTKIRLYTKLGLSVEEMCPSEVIGYIKERDLYSSDEYYSFVREKLTEKRLNHTAGVILTAIRLAEENGVDKGKAEKAALLHDVAKYMDPKDYPNFKLDGNVPSPVVHQFLGEYIARVELKIEDEDILNAIKYHTTGRPNMSTLEKIIFVADLIEPSRTYADVDYLRKEIDKNFNEGFRICIIEIYKYLQRSTNEIYSLTKEAVDYYKKN